MPETLESHGLITAIKPIKGGWRYPQKHGDEVWWVPSEGEARTADKLVEAIKEFRACQGIPLGDPVYDVATYFKNISPANDRFKGRIIGKPRIQERQPIIKDIRAHLENCAATKPELCGEDEATARATACLHCPQNIKWEVSGCADCNQQVEYKGKLLRRRVEFGLDPALKACRLHRFYLPSAVFIDRDALPARHKESPGNCWVGKPPDLNCGTTNRD